MFVAEIHSSHRSIALPLPESQIKISFEVIFQSTFGEEKRKPEFWWNRDHTIRILIGIGGNPHSDTSHLWNTWISTLLDLGVPQALSRCKGFLVHEMSDYGYIDKHRGQLSVAPSWSRSYLDVFYVALNAFGIGLIIDHRKKSNDRARTNELFISNVPLWR